VFTSDAAARWDVAWTVWPGFDAFWKQQLAWTMRPPGDEYSRVAVSREGDAAKVLVELFDAGGDPLSFATLRGRVSGSDEEVRFRQTGPGRYEATVEGGAPGVRLLAVEYTAPDGKRGALRAAIVEPEGEELRNPTPARDLLQQAATLTNGRVYTLNAGGADLWIREHVKFPISSRPVWLIAAITGIALFLVDVAGRRISIDPARLSAGVAGLFMARPVKRSATLGSLSAAKERAAAGMERSAAPAQPTEATPETRVPDPGAVVETASARRVEEAKEEAGGMDAMSRLHAAKRRANER
jgi:hypothetical protein